MIPNDKGPIQNVSTAYITYSIMEYQSWQAEGLRNLSHSVQVWVNKTGN